MWNRAFWGEPSELIANTRISRTMLAVLVGLAIVIVAFGVGFQPILEAARAGADAATDGSGYADAVLGGVGS